MKKALLVLTVFLIVLLPLCAVAEEKLPRFRFPAANYVGYEDYDFVVSMEMQTVGSLASSKMMQLRDQNGRVWAEKEFKPGAKQLTFKVPLDKSYLGGYDLSVWCGDTLVSGNSAYVAVTNRHQKAVVKVDTQEPCMSISLDCAYIGGPTDEILGILDEFGVKATFFMTGEFVLNFPEEAKRIRDAGHEIGCHSLSHPHLLDYGLDMRFKQVRRNVEIIRDTLGVNPRLFRPPFGEFDVTISAPARAEGMEVCLWSIDSHDWDWDRCPEPEKVVKIVTKDVTPGTIILFHLDGFFTPEVLRQVILYYQNELGLTLVLITELMAKGGLTLPACPYEDAQ